MRGDAGTYEIVARLDQTPGNVAVSPNGRIFLSQHPFGGPEARVVELLADGSTAAYPNATWSGAIGGDGVGIAAIIGIECAPDGTLWMLDAGDATTPPKLIGWDTFAERLRRVIHLPPPASRDVSFIQDLAIDPVRDAAYLADMGGISPIDDARPAIVVVDLRTGASRRLLEDHPLLRAERGADMVIDGRPVEVEGAKGRGVEPRVALNPIAIDPAHEWVYFGAMHGTSVHRVRAADLVDDSLDREALGARIERYGDKPVSDGLSVDQDGNVYITDLEGHAIGVTRPDGTYEPLIVDRERLQWPDGMSYAPDGRYYVTVNQLHRHPTLSAGEDRTAPPFLLIRFEPLAPSAIGR